MQQLGRWVEAAAASFRPSRRRRRRQLQERAGRRGAGAHRQRAPGILAPVNSGRDLLPERLSKRGDTAQQQGAEQPAAGFPHAEKNQAAIGRLPMYRERPDLTSGGMRRPAQRAGMAMPAAAHPQAQLLACTCRTAWLDHAPCTADSADWH